MYVRYGIRPLIERDNVLLTTSTVTFSAVCLSIVKMAIKTGRALPDDETMTPPVYEQGANIGPDIAKALECEHLDADLFRSANVGVRCVIEEIRSDADTSHARNRSFGDRSVLVVCSEVRSSAKR